EARWVDEDGRASVQGGQRLARDVADWKDVAPPAGAAQLAGQALRSPRRPSGDHQRGVGKVRREKVISGPEPAQVLARVDGPDVEDIAFGKSELLADRSHHLDGLGREDRVGAEWDVDDAVGRDMVQVDDLAADRL